MTQQAQQPQEEDFTVSVDGSEYKVSELDGEDQRTVAHLRDLESQQSQLAFRHDQLSAAKKSFSDQLVESIKAKKKLAEDAEKSAEASSE